MPVMTDRSDEGIKTVESEKHINAFFRELGVSLTAKCYKSSSISDLPAFLEENLRSDRDVWVEYHTDEIFNDETCIHDGLIESFNSTAKSVTIIDPMPHHRQRISVPLETLKRAVSGKFGRETGFVVVCRIS